MELWFTEPHTESVRFSMKVDKQVYSGKSEFQRIDIFDSLEFGRVLVLDGYTMLTEKDEFMYHEMIVHVPMCAHPNVRRVLDHLVKNGIVPIINENDVVADEEIKGLTFGDNDQLSALIARLVCADALVLLTTVDGLLDDAGRRVP